MHQTNIARRQYIRNIVLLVLLICIAIGLRGMHTYVYAAGTSGAVSSQQSGSVGVEGTIASPPPKQAATITIPTTGQVITSIPIKVSGLCPKGLLIKLFKNNVFAGSAQCIAGSYTIQADLFSGANNLVAKDYDALNQAGPNSNTVAVTYKNAVYTQTGPRISLTTSYAKIGVNPGDTLTWPLVLSGGSPPYAVSINWGDNSKETLLSEQFAGSFDAKHVYSKSGVYNIIVKATDHSGGTAFLQLVGVANGPIAQTASNNAASGSAVSTVIKVIWWPAVVLIPFILAAFWLGKRHELSAIRKKLEQGKW